MQILNISASSWTLSAPRLLKVYITARDSFIAKNIMEQLDYDFTATGRDQLDLTNSEAVDAFFEDKYFDVVIHTACMGGRRTDKETRKTFDDNYDMFENLRNNQDRFRYLINLGSGADTLGTHYGNAKKVIANIIREKPNMFNLRCFGVWGKYEKPDRFPSYCTTHKQVTIKEDKLMRYIHVDRLVNHINGLILDWPLKTREITVGEPVLLSEFAKQLNPNIKVIVKGKGKDYI